MEIWIPLTIIAAAVQAVRTALQKHLTASLTVFGATFSRFLFGLPMILGALAAFIFVFGYSMPKPNEVFIAYAWVGGLAQLLGNALLLHLLGFSTLTVGTTFTKTEVIQSVVVSHFVLDDRVETAGLFGILIAFIGVLLMAASRTGVSMANLVFAVRHKPALYGLIVGALYAIAAVFYRSAALSLEDGDFIIRALTTLAWVTVAQAMVMGFWLRFGLRGLISDVLRAWPLGMCVGLTGIVASACWYMAFTLQNASYVMAIGQIELVFAFMISWFLFRERMVPAEMIGVVITASGILVVILLG